MDTAEAPERLDGLSAALPPASDVSSLSLSFSHNNSEVDDNLYSLYPSEEGPPSDFLLSPPEDEVRTPTRKRPGWRSLGSAFPPPCAPFGKCTCLPRLSTPRWPRARFCQFSQGPLRLVSSNKKSLECQRGTSEQRPTPATCCSASR